MTESEYMNLTDLVNVRHAIRAIHDTVPVGECRVKSKRDALYTLTAWRDALYSAIEFESSDE